MKHTDLEKLKGLKIQGKLKGSGTPERYGKASASGRQTGQPQANSLLARLLHKRDGEKA